MCRMVGSHSHGLARDEAGGHTRRRSRRQRSVVAREMKDAPVARKIAVREIVDFLWKIKTVLDFGSAVLVSYRGSQRTGGPLNLH